MGERLPWRTRLVIVLLGAAVGSAAYGLAEIAFGMDAALAVTIVAIGIGLGWAMAAASTRGQVALVLALMAGLALLTVRIGRISGQLLAIPVELARFLSESLRLGEIVPADSVVAAVVELALDLGVLYGRLWLWLRTLATDEWVMDPVASAFAWSVLIWCASIWAAWSVRRRRQPLAAIIPILALLGIAFVISRGRPSSFVMPLGGTLLLMAFASHDARARRWKEARIDSPEGKTSSLAIIVLPIAVLLTAAAALTQSFSLIRIVNVVEGIVGGQARDERALAASLGLSRGSASETGLDSVLVPGLPNRHLIGSGPELSERLVMEVTVVNVPVEGPVPGFRWRALTYDQYQGHGWQTSNLLLENFAAGELLAEPVTPTDQVIRQWVREIGDLGGLVFSAGSPVVLDQEVQVAWRLLKEDIFTLTAEAPLYQVESVLPHVSQAELRAAGTEYPDWVKETYLALPEDVPARVLSLGRDLTATSATPYDRAMAIESYLRAIPYTLDVPRPPLDRDIVDHFLFDLKEGYCDYYASSMVVLARAAGLPARLVVGFFTGTAQPTEGTVRYVVSEAEAHSWVEVYFPDIGWVEFDPTGGRPAIERANIATTLDPADSPSLELAQGRRFEIRTDVPLLVGGALLGLIGAWLTWVMFLDPFRLQRREPGEALLALYERLRRLVSHLGIESSASDTPYEFQASLLDGLADRSQRIRDPARELILAHVMTAYSRESKDRALSARHIRAWRGLSFRLWIERMKRAVQSSLKRLGSHLTRR
jgi:hypothetical protein